MHEGSGDRLHVALTGATGFIGRRLQRHLLDSGHAVTVLIRPESAHRHHVDPRARVHAVSLTDSAGLARVLGDAQAVVYAAGSVRGRGDADFRPVNVDGVEAICVALAARVAPPRLLLISSLAATRPALSPYAASKAAGEAVVRGHDGLDWTILRPPAVYGPGDRELLPLFSAMRAGLALRIGPAAQRLSLLHVDDLAAAVAAWLEHGAACRHASYAIDDGQPDGHGWPELHGVLRGARMALPLPVPRALLDGLARINIALAGLIGHAPMLTPGKVRELSEPAWLCDNSAFTAATAWQPRIALGDGVRALFDGSAPAASHRAPERLS